MGYVIVKGTNGEPDRYFGEIHPGDEIMLCDACNEPRATSDGKMIHDNQIDLAWLCCKCNAANHG